MITILTWIAIISGGVLILLLLLSIVGGLDLDFDLPGHADIDVHGDADGAGGLGILKGGLALLAVGAWVARIVMLAEKHPVLALVMGLLTGLVTAWLLNLMMKFLLANDAYVNWSAEDALMEEAKVYLRIPAQTGYGLIKVDIKGATRELKAVSADQTEIATGDRVVIQSVKDDIATVLKI